MEFGAVFPQNEIGNDPIAMRDYAQAAEQIGYTHLLMYDHVLGADPSDRPGGWRGPYTKDHPFHEPFVTFGYLAGLTSTIEFSTAVLVLPQRQTALMAKQAAEVDLLSGGRLRLGVGTGWNRVEYQALGEDFHTRGKRQEEQIALMRALWSDEVVDFDGRWHQIDRAGLNPRPSRQIPLWIGGHAEPVLRRTARIGDGWVPVTSTTDGTAQQIDRLRDYLRQEGRDAETFPMQAQAQIHGGSPELWRRHARWWLDRGCSHLAIATMSAGCRSVGDHIDAIRAYWDTVQDL